MAESLDRNRTYWSGAAVFTKWHIEGPWSLAVRPEIYWDQNGRQTGSEQLVKAVTTTVEYKIAAKASEVFLRLEHRYDDSTGAQGGFFKGDMGQAGSSGLTHDQHLVFLAILYKFGT